MIRILAALSLGLGVLHASDFPQKLLKNSPAWYGSEEGKKTTACILSWQSESGSWPKAKNTTGSMNSAPRSKLQGTFDNSSTTNELRYLARAYGATKDEACKTAFMAGLDCILKGQYPNGGWPQYYPPDKKGYPRHITFNDDAFVRLLRFLTELTTDETYQFVGDKARSSALAAIDRGIGCILKCQIVFKGKPTVWCAQHDENTLAPATARAYELPSFSGSESAGIVRYLMSLDKPSPEVIASVKAAVAWFEKVKIPGIKVEKVDGDRKVIQDPSAPGLWARFYDLETGAPYFCDRDGVKKATLAEIGSERRNGYAWYGNWGESVAREYAKWPHR